MTHQRGTGRRPSRGFTLVELVVAMGISALVLTALGSAVLIATRALPGAGDPAPVRASMSSALDTLAEDLRLGTAFTSISERGITITVPDRDADGLPETIRYEWSGKATDPVTRQVNASPPGSLTDAVQNFVLSYTTVPDATVRTSVRRATSPETLFASMTAWTSVPSPSFSWMRLSDSGWAGAYFAIASDVVPNDATNVRITRVGLLAQAVDALDTFTIGIHAPLIEGMPEPAPTPIGSVAMVSGSVVPSTFGWLDVVMPSNVIFAVRPSGLVIVGKGVGRGAADWRMLSSSSAPRDAAPVGLWSNNSGNGWQPIANSQYKNDYVFSVYGTYERQETVVDSSPIVRLVSVEVVAVPATPGAGELRTRANVLSAPEVALP